MTDDYHRMDPARVDCPAGHAKRGEDCWWGGGHCQARARVVLLEDEQRRTGYHG